jgi:pilus assembly protein CpaF
MTKEIPITIKRGFEVIQSFKFAADSKIRIGREPTAHICLESFEVSRRHATIALKEAHAEIEDLSQNGIYVRKERLDRQAVVPYGAVLDIPPFQLILGTSTDAQIEDEHELCARILTRLVENIDLDILDRNDADLRLRVEAAVERIASDEGLPEHIDKAKLIRDLSDEALGLGPLEKLLKDESVSEIMVIEPHCIFVERKGRLEKTNLTFTSEKAVRTVIDRIIAPLGRRIDELSPMVDARLPDGSRVNAVVPPLAIRGSCITIRKFSKIPLTMMDLIRFGSLTKQMAEMLENAVASRANIIISGGTGSGKTTLLGVLSNAIPEGERIVTIEDAAELRLGQSHVVSLESRPANAEGTGAVTIRDLVKNALRMRPDRIVVGECRSGEALDMLQAMNTGHDGSLTTLHANSPKEAVSRLETLCLMAGVSLPSRAIREQIAAAVNLVVQQTRMADGARRITGVSEVTGIEEDGEIQMNDLYRYITDPDSGEGEYAATGRLPQCLAPRTSAF